MIKFAKTDVADGLKLLKIGIHNIIQFLVDDKITEYKLDFKISYLIVAGVIRELFPDHDIKYSDGVITLNIENKVIGIVFEDDYTLFYL